METAKIIADALEESLRLLLVLPNEPRMRDQAAAVRLIADKYGGTGSIDLSKLEKCLRRMRIAAVARKYPNKWPDDQL